MKKSKLITVMVAATALAMTPALVACSNDRLKVVDFPKNQDTSYIVTSQGGSAVGYGNYVYFINGTRGYDDEKGADNVWGNVVKGGLYRAELNGSAIDNQGYKSFSPTLNAKNGLEFKYTEGKDYYSKPINIVNTEAVAPKTVGTSGYAKGGIFIYDDYVYFASPNNDQNSTGTVQTKRTDFFMMSLTSSAKPVRVYTTSQDVDTTAAEYAFYHYNGAVYLIVKEDTNIVSVKLNPAKNKADNPVTFKVNATSVYFPVKDTYYKGIDENGVEDYIYFVRAVTDDDDVSAGTVIEAMRPDGSENFVVSENGKTETIEAVRDGVVFWRSENVLSKTIIKYDNLADSRYEYNKAYKDAQDKLQESEKERQIDGSFDSEITSSITSTFAFKPDKSASSSMCAFVGITSDAVYVYEQDGNVGNVRLVAKSATGTPLFISDGYLYYNGSNSDYYRIQLFENRDNFGVTQEIAKDTVSGGISYDFVDGYFTYFGKVDDWATGYTFFSKVDGYSGLEPQFVGKRSEADIPSDDDINGTSTDTDTESDE